MSSLQGPTGSSVMNATEPRFREIERRLNDTNVRVDVVLAPRVSAAEIRLFAAEQRLTQAEATSRRVMRTSILTSITSILVSAIFVTLILTGAIL